MRSRLYPWSTISRRLSYPRVAKSSRKWRLTAGPGPRRFGFLFRRIVARSLSPTKFLAMVLFFTPFTALPANWYVDKIATGSGTGASWADAWTRFSDINWGDILAGDTIT